MEVTEESNWIIYFSAYLDTFNYLIMTLSIFYLTTYLQVVVLLAER